MADDIEVGPIVFTVAEIMDQILNRPNCKEIRVRQSESGIKWVYVQKDDSEMAWATDLKYLAELLMRAEVAF